MSNAKRPVVFGEVLFDCFPDGSVVLGGAPFNVAWHLQAFGQRPLFISRVGDDPLGRRIRDTMLAWDMDTTGLQKDSAHPTGTVQVRIEDGEPDYDIVEDRAYDFMEAESLPPIDNAALIYHGSLALRGDASRRCFRRLGETHDLPRFVDVNLRDPWWQRQQVRDLLRGASWVKLNEKELELLGDGPDDGAGERFRHAFGLQSLILTRGGEGAQLLGQGSVLDVAPEPAERVVDTVGAGDAFASIILLGLLNGWSEKLTLERAQSFASAMVGVRGATVQERDFYRHFAAVWGLASA